MNVSKVCSLVRAEFRLLHDSESYLECRALQLFWTVSLVPRAANAAREVFGVPKIPDAYQEI